MTASFGFGESPRGKVWHSIALILCAKAALPMSEGRKHIGILKEKIQTPPNIIIYPKSFEHRIIPLITGVTTQIRSNRIGFTFSQKVQGTSQQLAAIRVVSPTTRTFLIQMCKIERRGREVGGLAPWVCTTACDPQSLRHAVCSLSTFPRPVQRWPARKEACQGRRSSVWNMTHNTKKHGQATKQYLLDLHSFFEVRVELWVHVEPQELVGNLQVDV